MSEINEEKTDSLYPNIARQNNQPTAPVAIFEMGDNGQSFRLRKISGVADYLEKELKERERLAKKYLKISQTVDNIEGVLTVAALGAGAGEIALLSTIVAIPATIALEGCAKEKKKARGRKKLNREGKTGSPGRIPAIGRKAKRWPSSILNHQNLSVCVLVKWVTLIKIY